MPMKILSTILACLLCTIGPASLSADGQRTDIHAEATAVRPLLPGMRAPAFQVRDARGAPVAFDPDHMEKPLVLTFFRGGWCPYCNLHLAELRKAEAELEQMGFDIWFLSVDRPELLYESLEQPDIAEILNRILGKELAKLCVQLGSKRFVRRNDDCWPPRLRDHVCHRERLAGPGHSQQRLELQSIIQSLHQPGNRAGLEASRAFGLAFRVPDELVEKYLAYGVDLEAVSGQDHHVLPVPSTFIVGSDGVIQFQYSNPDYKVRLHPDVLLAAARAYANDTEKRLIRQRESS